MNRTAGCAPHLTMNRTTRTAAHHDEPRAPTMTFTPVAAPVRI
jgi:hypothetical protein